MFENTRMRRLFFKIGHIPEAAQICDLSDRTVRLSQKSGRLG